MVLYILFMCTHRCFTMFLLYLCNYIRFSTYWVQNFHCRLHHCCNFFIIIIHFYVLTISLKFFLFTLCSLIIENCIFRIWWPFLIWVFASGLPCSRRRRRLWRPSWISSLLTSLSRFSYRTGNLFSSRDLLVFLFW